MSEIKEFTYSTGSYSFTLCNAAASIRKICVPDKNGNILNVVLPVNDVNKTLGNPSCLGFTVGRFANRISNASFELNGKLYSFEPNDGANLLHCGKGSTGYRIWDVRKESDGFTCFCRILSSQDGFPGDLDVWVRYSMTATGVFSVRYKILCTEDTPVNFTNHSYFNLSGNPDNLILNHRVKFSSSKYLEQLDGRIPSGKVLNVQGSEFDFTNEKEIGCDIPKAGYDHTFVIDRPFEQTRGFIQFCTVTCKETGIVMKGYTDMPAFQFYTGDHLADDNEYKSQSGFCLETGNYTDAINKPQFPSCVLKAGTLFESTTSYAFSAEASR